MYVLEHFFKNKSTISSWRVMVHSSVLTGNKCYKVIGSQMSDRKNYTAARDDCRNSGGDIASISSHIELGNI